MKINNNEYLDLVGNEFYQIVYFISEQKIGSKWLAKVKPIRRDTMESVKGGFNVFESDKNVIMEKIKKRVDESLFPELEKAGKPPDWNSEIRKILLKCNDVTNRLMRFGTYSIDHPPEQKAEYEYWSEYAQYWQDIIKDTIAVNRMVEALDDKDRIELLTISDSSLQDPSDIWSLNDIDFRLAAFRFFSCPSEQEKRHHELQLERLARRHDELGWK